MYPGTHHPKLLLLSLGHDDQLTIKRMQPKDFTERRKIFSSKIRETYLFEISIKNNKAKAVTVELIDQFPISYSVEYPKDKGIGYIKG